MLNISSVGNDVDVCRACVGDVYSHWTRMRRGVPGGGGRCMVGVMDG